MLCPTCDGAGCYQCCDDCRDTTHCCPGCGITLAHRVPVCMDCQRAIAVDRRTITLAALLTEAAGPAGLRRELAHRLAHAAVRAGWQKKDLP